MGGESFRMSHDVQQEPWEHLRNLFAASSPHTLRDYLGTLAPGEAARMLSQLEPEEHVRLLTLLGLEDAARLTLHKVIKIALSAHAAAQPEDVGRHGLGVEFHIIT